MISSPISDAVSRGQFRELSRYSLICYSPMRLSYATRMSRRFANQGRSHVPIFTHVRLGEQERDEGRGMGARRPPNPRLRSIIECLRGGFEAQIYRIYLLSPRPPFPRPRSAAEDREMTTLQLPRRPPLANHMIIS